MKPTSGGMTRLPAPQPMKKMLETRPVTFILAATQEKQALNCQETKKPMMAVLT